MTRAPKYSYLSVAFTNLNQCGTKRHSSTTSNPLLTLCNHNAASLASLLHQNGYTKTTHPILPYHTSQQIKIEMSKLFRGEFDTGVYPDEWHWRKGISLPNAAREICNGWKSSRFIASIILNESIGKIIASIMGWESVRIGQDDLIWKPPSIETEIPQGTKKYATNRIDTVGFHQDSAYISSQFEPYENNSVTLWMALDDADEETGCVEYAAGSHKWRPILHQNKTRGSNFNSVGVDDDMSSFHSSDETSYRNGMSRAAKLAGVIDPNSTIKSASVKEGYAILHNQDVWHGSGPNLSNMRHRRALVGHYIRGDISFRKSENVRQTGPFGDATYIYGRYKRFNRLDLDESFFPIIYGPNRTAWIDDFIRTEHVNGR